ncbi:hypothetical protein [Arcanobacterium bovis]|uniref:hypothetical protein n=1 Tax=Arcanobacterium bovis TaxID=2529275 RepID=UPI0013F169FC|nr:hypothetical protein [Arcanobacterium bovis]
MCSEVTCSTCGKATWAGCGQHIESALAGVPQSQRCTCEKTSNGGFFGRIFGR